MSDSDDGGPGQQHCDRSGRDGPCRQRRAGECRDSPCRLAVHDATVAGTRAGIRAHAPRRPSRETEIGSDRCRGRPTRNRSLQSAQPCPATSLLWTIPGSYRASPLTAKPCTSSCRALAAPRRASTTVRLPAAVSRKWWRKIHCRYLRSLSMPIASILQSARRDRRWRPEPQTPKWPGCYGLDSADSTALRYISRQAGSWTQGTPHAKRLQRVLQLAE